MLERFLYQMAKEIDYSIHPGVSIEIQDFLRDHENVTEYKIASTEDGRYSIWVKLGRYGDVEVQRIFHSFVNFIEFTDATFYVRRTNNETINYVWLSATEDGLAFLCEITFAP